MEKKYISETLEKNLEIELSDDAPESQKKLFRAMVGNFLNKPGLIEVNFKCQQIIAKFHPQHLHKISNLDKSLYVNILNKRIIKYNQYISFSLDLEKVNFNISQKFSLLDKVMKEEFILKFYNFIDIKLLSEFNKQNYIANMNNIYNDIIIYIGSLNGIEKTKILINCPEYIKYFMLSEEEQILLLNKCDSSNINTVIENINNLCEKAKLFVLNLDVELYTSKYGHIDSIISSRAIEEYPNIALNYSLVNYANNDQILNALNINPLKVIELTNEKFKELNLKEVIYKAVYINPCIVLDLGQKFNIYTIYLYEYAMEVLENNDFFNKEEIQNKIINYYNVINEITENYEMMLACDLEFKLEANEKIKR